MGFCEERHSDFELVRDDEEAAETYEGTGLTGEGEEVEDGLGVAKECREGVTVTPAEGAREEEDLGNGEMGDLGAELEEVVLEDAVLLSPWW